MLAPQNYSQLLNELLTDYRNQNPAADTSKGSMIFLKSASLAGLLWGFYQQLNYLARQQFADTCDRTNLEHHATLRGLSLIPGESTAALLERVLLQIRRPPAGGNRYDYQRWAKEISGVAGVTVIPLGQGVGTLDLVLLADVSLTGSEIPTSELLAQVRAHIVEVCPNDVKYLRVLAPEILLQDVAIVRSNALYPAASAIADITTYLDAFTPGQALYLDQLKALALGGNSGSAPVTTPAADVEPTPYQLLRPGVIDVL